MNANILKCTYDVVVFVVVDVGGGDVGGGDGSFFPCLAQRFLCVSLKRLLCSLSDGRTAVESSFPRRSVG